MRKRLTKGERKELILQAACRVVEVKGSRGLTHEEVAEWCEIETSVATVRRYFGSWSDLANAIIGHPACPKLFKDYMGSLK